MACTLTVCLICLVSTVRGRCKNHLGRASARSRHNTNLEQSTFLRNLWEASKAQCYKTLYVRNLQMFVTMFVMASLSSLVNGISFEPSLMCVGKTRSLP
jgi:hypothetical protein